jgi:diguanylate cyclase (GGDEF)-like protein
MRPVETSMSDALALLRSGAEEYYRHADVPLVRRIGGAAIALAVVLCLGLLALSPPDAVLPAGLGWAIAGAVVAAGVLPAALLLGNSERMTLDATFAIAVTAVLGFGVLSWLAGAEAVYGDVMVLVLVWSAATHTARRVGWIVVVAGLAQVPSLLVDGRLRPTAEWAVEFTIYAALTAFALLWTAWVRAQRAALRREGTRAMALARVDPLTGLGNRRAFDEALWSEVARAERSGRPLALLIADLDGFKAINDVHGHLAGDSCLRQVAGVVRSAVRRPDACFRWGGDEFALVLAETDVAAAEGIATRLTAAVAETCRAPSGAPLAITCGVALLDEASDADVLLERADAALMAAKS